MTFFSIFKKKPEPSVVNISGKTGIDLISDGILFDQNVFLQWGADIEGDKLYSKKEYRADRTIYHWGERPILNGLTLYFKTICWNHKQNGDTKSFESIDFLSEDNETEAIFEKVKAHLIGIFGEPKLEEDVKQGDIALEWKIKAVKISLNLFYKDRKKVHLEVGWWL
ncbi:MAG TPA: hypothetical protein VK671_17160 [Mucilaginibacter sp.]|nr:hypothetical protein [Mucilaginibacter sp.]